MSIIISKKRLRGGAGCFFGFAIIGDLIMEELRGSKDNPVHVSCGGVVYRKNKKKREVEVLLLHRFKSKDWPYDSWHLPKGTQRKGESQKEAAAREIREETGFSVRVGRKIAVLESTYQIDDVKIKKTTHYFLCQPLKRVSRQVGEHDEVRWVSFKEAVRLLSKFKEFEKEEEVLLRWGGRAE